MSEPTNDTSSRLPNAGSEPVPPPLPDEGGGGGMGGGLLAIGAVALLFAVVAFVLMRSMGTPEEEVATPVRSGGPAAAEAQDLPDVALTLYVERGGRAEPLPPGQDVAVGDNVLFELSSETAAPVRLWIEEAGAQIEDLGTIDADPKPAMIGAEGGMLAWNFGSSRTVTVRASAAPRGCPATSCASQVVVAK
ncbi:hypothetical protein L6R53_00875 [Myxococcota bacterium]|nr:hypothetical protein [Myxococcota bacterium]